MTPDPNLFAEQEQEEKLACAEAEDKAIRGQRRHEEKGRRRLQKQIERTRRGKSPPSEHRVKAFVRKRDKYRCRDCGMTANEHREKFGKNLHVHRVFAGWIYHPSICVTLCRTCHAAKKGREQNDTFGIWWNFYDPGDFVFLGKLAEEAKRLKLTLPALMDKILREHFSGQEVSSITRMGDGRP